MQYDLSFCDSGLGTRQEALRPRSLTCELDKNSEPAAGKNLINLFGGSEADERTRAAVLDEILRIHEYERWRMGQELHDSAGQLLIALHLSVAHLREVEKESGHEALIDEVQNTIGQIDRQIRSLAFLHYPAELDERGLCSAVERLLRGFGARTGIRTSLKFAGDFGELGAAISEGLLRVAQEALVNIHRHAHALSVKIRLEKRGGDVQLTVSDDGVGLPSGDGGFMLKGVGMQSMQHRARMLGGKLQIRSMKHGTKVVATIPAAA